MVEAQVAVVCEVVAELCADISDFDARQWHVVLEAPDLDNERRYTVILVVDDESREDNGMRCMDSKGPGPELCCFNVGCVDHKLILILVERSGSFKTRNV